MKTPSEYISEAHRYLKNGKETIGKSPIQYGRYEDSKYVAEAAGITYLSALKAIDGYLVYRGYTKNELPRSIEEYQDAIRKKIPLNGKLMGALNTAYEILHISAYYRELNEVNAIKIGFQSCRKVIEMMENLMSKPNTTPVMVQESSTPYVKKKRQYKKKIRSAFS